MEIIQKEEKTNIIRIPLIGSEQDGYRPVIVIQNNVGNQHSPTVIVAAISSRTSTKAKLPVHVQIPHEAGLEQNSIVLLEQLRTVDKSRLSNYIGRLDKCSMDKIDEALSISIGLSQNNFKDEGMLLCLCPACASQFYNSSEHIIRRADPFQSVKGACTYCSVRMGYDYKISRKKGVFSND